MDKNVSASEQTSHQALTPTSHDEKARQDFVRSYKEYLVKNIHAGNRERYDNTVKPNFEKLNDREPSDRFEVRDLMVDDPYYQMFSSLLRTSQEMMWSSCQIPVENNLNDLNANIKAMTDNPVGTLSLRTETEVPRYHTAVDIHCQPGGYHSEFVEEDASPGMVYDRAVHIYAMGQLGPFNDDLGASIVLWLRENHPEFKPSRILDLGCAVGHSTVPYVKNFPDAEIHAVDVAAPMLRYAHARAKDLNAPIHFSQQNAEHLDYPDEHFDLIVSHILLHETSDKAIRNIMKECQRLLSPGGLTVHAETPPYKNMDPFEAFMLDWDNRNNNEPFWARSHEIDLDKLSKNAGFSVDKKFESMIPSAFQIEEVKKSEVFQGGDFGGGGQWFIYGNWK